MYLCAKCLCSEDRRRLPGYLTVEAHLMQLDSLISSSKSGCWVVAGTKN